RGSTSLDLGTGFWVSRCAGAGLRFVRHGIADPGTGRSATGDLWLSRSASAGLVLSGSTAADVGLGGCAAAYILLSRLAIARLGLSRDARARLRLRRLAAASMGLGRRTSSGLIVSGRTEARGVSRFLAGESGLRRSLGGSLSRGWIARALISRALIGRAWVGRASISCVLISAVLISGALISGPTGRRCAFRFGSFPRCPSDLAIYGPVHLIGNVVRPPRPPGGATVVRARLLSDEVRHLRRNRQRQTGSDRQTAVLLFGSPALLAMI